MSQSSLFAYERALNDAYVVLFNEGQVVEDRRELESEILRSTASPKDKNRKLVWLLFV